jgi:hypothetical protein
MEEASVLSYITELRLNCFTWSQISRKLDWSISTLWRWREANNFQEPLRIAPIEEIIEIVKLYILERKLRGEVMLMGHLRGAINRIWISMVDLRVIINSVR